MANQTKQLKALLEQSGAQVELVAVNAPYKPSWAGKIPVLRALFRLIPYFFSLYRVFKRSDVVHVMANSGWSWHLFAAPAIWVGKMTKCPVVLNYRGGHAAEFFERSWQTVNRSLSKVHSIVVPSDYLKEVFQTWGKEATVIPNVLNEKRFYPEQESSAKDEKHIIVTRNLELIYDIETAIRCFDELRKSTPNARLSIAGTGPEKANLEALVDELGLSEVVTFVGQLNLEQVSELYRSADMMLNTSTVDNSPNSVIEALACGVSVVSTNVGGIPKLVKHERDALLVDPRQPVVMAEQAKRLLEDDELRHQLMQNGFETIDKFKWQNVRSRLYDEYHKVMAKEAS